MNSSLNNTFFYALEGNAAALPCSLTIAYFKTELDSIVLSNDVDEVGKYLDHLDDNKLITHIQKTILVSDINSLGLKNAARRTAEILIPRLSILLQVIPQNIYRTVDSPPSYYYKTNIVSQKDELYKYCVATNWINFFQRRWYATKIASFKYPMYNWDKDYGLVSNEQMLLCLKYGLCHEYHHLDFILSFGERLYELQTTKSFTELYKNVYYPHPAWWKPYTGLIRFYDNLEQDKRLQMQRLHLGSSEYNKTTVRSRFIETNRPKGYMNDY